MYFIGFMKHFPIRGGSVKYTEKGDVRARFASLDVEFQKSAGVPDYAREAVSRLPQFMKGLGIDEDPFSRVSHFDTEIGQQVNGWSDDDRKIVEAALLSACGADFVCADQPRLAPPWPAYDKLVAQGRRTIELVAEKIVETVTENGYDPGQVILYEQENLNRPAVIEALEALAIEATPESVEEIIAA